MAVQNPFFGRRDPEPLQPRTGSGAASGNLGNAVPGSPMASVLAAATTPSQALAGHGGDSTSSQHASDSGGGSKLTVGPNITLKGVEITDCDTLVVEGTVEATMDSRVIQIAEQGAFRGSADIDIAEIRGEFNGTLNVRERLVIFGTGRVTGKIRCGKLVVEEGGQLSGEIEMGTGTGTGKGAASGGSMVAPSAAAPVAQTGRTSHASHANADTTTAASASSDPGGAAAAAARPSGTAVNA